MSRAWLLAALAVLTLLDGGAGVVRAADEKIDIFKLRFDLGLWSIIVFLTLYFLLKKVAWGPILQGLQKRELTIQEQIEKAEKAQAEMARNQAEFERKLAEAHAEIPKLLEEARRNAQAVADEMRARAQQDIQAERQRLRREIDTARDQALQDIWRQSAQLATLISAKAIKRHLSEEDHRRLVDDALAELQQEADRRRRIV